MKYLKRNVLLILTMVSLTGFCFAQTQITGVVRDRQGETLPGVAVALKNTIRGAVSDIDGNYTINAPADAILVFSYIGFTTIEQPVGGRQTIDVVLTEESQFLDEVVVTAIGIRQQKKKLGYTTQQVNSETLAVSKTMNVGNALSGQIAGLTVDNPTGIFQAPAFSLRGKSPLIVLDGVPMETDFFDISNEDIESINVLKGTTASALYGSRGKNGAILITRKSAANDGLEINVGTNNMFTAGFTVFPKTQSQYGNGSYGKYEFWDGADGGISDGDMIWGPKFGTGAMVAQWNSPIRNKQTGETIDWWGDVAGTIYDDKSLYERVPIPWEYHHNLKDFLGTGVITNNNFSVAYKAGKGQYYFSGNYAYQKGQVPNTSLNTGGVNFNSTYQLSRTVQLNAAISYNKVYSPNYPRYGYGPKNHMYTILIWMGDDVNGKELKEHLYVPGQEGYRQANWNYAWYNNPYFGVYELQQKRDMGVTDGKLKLNWNILPNLNLQGRISARENRTYENMQSPKTYMNYGDSRNGDFKIWNTSQMNFDADVLASYFQTITNDLQLTVNAGASTFNRQWQQEYLATDGLIVPFVYSLNNTQGPVAASNTLIKKEIRSVYGSVNLDFMNAFFLNMTARNDWSSTLPTGNNSYFYPSVSLSTLVSEYVKMPDVIDYLKLYGSWAQVSNDLDPYSIMATYNKGVTYGSIPSVYYPEGLVNPNIMPEKSTSYEFGLSTAFLKNRIILDVTYYNIKDENQIVNLGISEASGFRTRKENSNVYATNGLEIVLGLKPVNKRSFSWDMNINWSAFVKKLTEIGGDAKKYGDLMEGDRADSYYATVWQKSASGEVVLDAMSGLPSRDPYKQNIGHRDPNWRLGFQNRFRVNNVKIEMDIDGAWGGLFRSLTVEKWWWGGKHPNSVEYRDAEYAAGKPIYVPNGVNQTGGELRRDVDGNVLSDTRTYTPNTTAVNWQDWCQIYPYQATVSYKENEHFANVFDRSYFKLRRLSVGYDLAKIWNTGNAKSVDVALFGHNLLMWKKTPFVDPDYGNDDNLQDPSPRYVGISLNLKF